MSNNNTIDEIPNGMDLWVNSKSRNRKRIALRKGVFKAKKFSKGILSRIKSEGADIKEKSEGHYRDNRNIKQFLDKKELSEYNKYVHEKDKYIEDNDNTEDNS